MSDMPGASDKAHESTWVANYACSVLFKLIISSNV